MFLGQESITDKGREMCSTLDVWGTPAQIICIPRSSQRLCLPCHKMPLAFKLDPVEAWHSQAWARVAADVSFQFHSEFLEEYCNRCCWYPAHTFCFLTFQSIAVYFKLPVLTFLWERSLTTRVHCICPWAPQPSSNTVCCKTPASFPWEK